AHRGNREADRRRCARVHEAVRLSGQCRARPRGRRAGARRGAGAAADQGRRHRRDRGGAVAGGLTPVGHGACADHAPHGGRDVPLRRQCARDHAGESRATLARRDGVAQSGCLVMASQSVARSESIAAFIPALELLIAEAMDEWKIPGLAVAVVQNGEVALVRAYGLRDVEAGLKVTTDTQFLIGSVTKSFTATGLALLVDERRLDWNKPVRDYIPEFRLHDAVATERITVRDLLCHHTGLPRHDWIWI